MSFLSRAFATAPKQEARSLDSFLTIPPNIPTAMEDALIQGDIADRGAMSLSAFFSCVSLLADTVASMPVYSYRKKNGIKQLVDPQPALFMPSPYPGLSWFDWLWMFMESLAITGNAFGYVTAFDDVGRAKSILPIHPSMIEITIPPEDPLAYTDKQYFIRGKRVPNNRIVHIKRFPIAGAAYGMSVIQKAAGAVELGLAAERYGRRYFKDSANPSGILSTKEDLTPEQAKRNMKQWLQSQQGRRLPAMLGGGLEWQQISITPEESQFLQTRQHQVREIAMWFRIPPHMISDTEASTSWGTGIEQQSIGFVTYTLRPWLECIEQMLTMLLPNGQFAKFDVDALLRGDITARWEAHQIAIQNGVKSINEVREEEDLAPCEEGDIHLQPMNFVPLGTDPAELQVTLAQMKGDQAIEQQKEAAKNQPQQPTGGGTDK